MARRRRSFKGVFERLLRFLIALGCEIEIKIAAAKAAKAGAVTIRESRRKAA